MGEHRGVPEPPVATGVCPKAELLALYLEGGCPAAQVAAVERHLAGCETCYAVFMASVRMDQSDRAGASDSGGAEKWRGRWFAVAFAAAALVLLMVAIERRADRSGRDLQVALLDLDRASRTYRASESRASLLPTYRPIQPVARSEGGVPPVSPDLQAAADRVRATASRQNAASQRALGTMYLALGDAGRAAAALEPLANSSDPGVMNDVAAAWLARAADGDESRAFALLNRAVAIERTRPDIWFNLALAATATGNRELMRTAWKQVISLEPNSPWAHEAQRRLERNPN